MDEERWFSYPIWHTNDLYIDNDELLKYCLLRKFYDKGSIKSNRGGWQSSNLYWKSDENIGNFCLHLQKHLDELSRKIEKKLVITNLWININGYNNSNITHIHPRAFISGIYYVSAETNQGDLCFENPLKFINQFAYLSVNFLEYNVYHKPKTGKLILFPSTLPHSVLPNETNNDRISISFNVEDLDE